MKFFKHLTSALVLSTTFFSFGVNSQGVIMEKAKMITSKTYSVKILANGLDVSATSPVVSVKYNEDGSGSRFLRDGKSITGQWRFLNPQQTQIEVTGPEGISRWVIVELTDKIYRKVNMDTGVEFIHLPKAP
jgi:hypothetical protein